MLMQVAHWKRKCERLEHQAVTQADAAAIEKDNERCARSHAQQAIAWVMPLPPDTFIFTLSSECVETTHPALEAGCQHRALLACTVVALVM